MTSPVPDKPYKMTPLYFLIRFLGAVLFKIYFRWNIYNAEYVPQKGSAIIVTNHASYLDPIFLGSSQPRTICYLARKTLFRNKIFGKILRNINAVPLDREGNGSSGLKTVLERLSIGEAIGLYPEGTRTPDGKLQSARSGIGLIVVKSTAPVIPARIFGAFEAYGRHVSFPKPYKIAIKYGKPIDFSETRKEAETCSKERLKEIYQEIANHIMQEIGDIHI